MEQPKQRVYWFFERSHPTSRPQRVEAIDDGKKWGDMPFPLIVMGAYDLVGKRKAVGRTLWSSYEEMAKVREERLLEMVNNTGFRSFNYEGWRRAGEILLQLGYPVDFGALHPSVRPDEGWRHHRYEHVTALDVLPGGCPACNAGNVVIDSDGAGQFWPHCMECGYEGQKHGEAATVMMLWSMAQRHPKPRIAKSTKGKP